MSSGRLHLIVSLLTASIGCVPTGPQPAETTELDCEMKGQPCALAEVSREVLTRGEVLSDQALAMIENGSTIADVVGWLLAEEGVVEAAGDDAALRFHVDGGREIWILGPDAIAPIPDDAAPGKSVNAPRSKPPAQHIVGDDVETKRALVLSPFKFQFGDQYDDGEIIDQLLSSARGYAGNVDYLENPEKNSKIVGIQQFLGWETYDVIHVTGHGYTFCDLNNCSAVIYTGDSYGSVDDLLQLTVKGVNTARAAGVDSKLYAVSADFFRDNYPGGLDKTIVFFNACQTIAAGDFTLAESLIGESSVYIGWSNVVQAVAAMGAAEALYADLSDNGVTVTSARDEIGLLGMNSYTSDKGEPVLANLSVFKREGRALRLREVVTLEDPQVGGMMFDGQTVQAIGTAEDDLAEVVPYQVLIEGVEEQEADDFSVEVTIDGAYTSGPQPASAGEAVGDHGYRITGQIAYVDVPSGGLTATIKALLQLPEGGTSEHEVMVSIVAESEEPDDEPAQTLGEVWVGEATGERTSHILNTSHRTVTARVTFEQVESPSYAPHIKVFQVREGRVSWSQDGTQLEVHVGEENYLCPYSDGPFEIPVSPSDGKLQIDTSVNPHTYKMFGLTNGPEVRLAENCDDVAFDTTGGGVWAAIYSFGEFFVQPGANQISGSRTQGSSNYEWSFTRQ